jgi:hypothetical protein
MRPSSAVDSPWFSAIQKKVHGKVLTSFREQRFAPAIGVR